MSDDKVNERTRGRTPNNASIDDVTLDQRTPIREPQPGESDHSEQVPERRDPGPRELPRKDCRVVFIGVHDVPDKNAIEPGIQVFGNDTVLSVDLHSLIR